MKKETIFVVSRRDDETHSVSHEPWNSDSLFFVRSYEGIKTWIAERHPEWEIVHFPNSTEEYLTVYDGYWDGEKHLRYYEIYCRSLY